ncbi:hypothetical protein A0H81_05351 [Grifola frondosa]|uniref:UPF0261 domain-containing protein n=1 Tax=Grifola frondosa TaxID=5627 RepID=A0A1C7MDR0_GRIFR|nr:hypothetical protein A0H81_05351 [Grifola frondosa]
MVNFGPPDSVPERFRGRQLYAHNPSVTLMRTTPAECALLGRRIAERVRGMWAEGTRVEVWVPRGGVSALSVRGAPFWDAEADEALFRALADGLRDGEGKGEGIRLVEDDRDVNDEGFVRAMVMRLVEMVGMEPLEKR